MILDWTESKKEYLIKKIKMYKRKQKLIPYIEDFDKKFISDLRKEYRKIDNTMGKMEWLSYTKEEKVNFLRSQIRVCYKRLTENISKEQIQILFCSKRASYEVRKLWEEMTTSYCNIIEKLLWRTRKAQLSK